MTDVIPSTENFAVAIWDRIVDHMPSGVTLKKVTLHETERHYVEYTGKKESPDE